jgi:hypothetical protein
MGVRRVGVRRNKSNKNAIPIRPITVEKEIINHLMHFFISSK